MDQIEFILYVADQQRSTRLRDLVEYPADPDGHIIAFAETAL